MTVIKSFCLLLFLSILITAKAQFPGCDKADKMMKTFELYHYSPSPLNDTLSLHVFNSFFELLDPETNFFTSKDINGFFEYRYKLDELIEDRSCEFLQKTSAKFMERMQIYQQWLEAQTIGTLKPDSADYIEFISERKISTDDKTLQNLWRKNLKYKYLVVEYLKEKYKDSLTYYAAIKPFEVVKERELCRINRLMDPAEGHEQRVLSTFMKAVALNYDPHSLYLSAHEKQVFDASLSVEAQGFGINVTQNLFGETEIYQILPGGPAWRSDSLKKGDVITLIKSDKNEIFDLYCSSVGETQAMLSASPYESIELVVRNSEGEIKTVKLKREVIEMEMNTLKSFILEGEKKIAYIQIPSFYTSYDMYDVNGVSEDLAKELMQLKRENIKGLILDLRSNAGGSLEEAVKISGIFIDQGPVLAVEKAGGEVNVIRDFNRGKIYDGPLLVMVNGGSASASELFAACMQDYGRAVVVGNTTFGKSTVQRVFPAFNQSYEVAEEFANITIEVFYRVTGESHQNKGVVPDIVLPEVFSSFYDKEDKYRNALKPGRLNTEMKYKKTNLPVVNLKEKSFNRLKEDDVFLRVTAIADSLAGNAKIKIPLHHGSFDKNFEQITTRWDAIGEIMSRQQTKFDLVVPEYKNALLQYDPVKQEDYNLTGDFLNKDIYLEESYNIIVDLMQYKK